MKLIIKPILRLICFAGYITLTPLFLYWVFTGRNYFELFDKINEL